MRKKQVVTKLLRFMNARSEALSLSVTSGGVDSMEKYQIYNRTNNCLRGSNTGTL